MVWSLGASLDEGDFRGGFHKSSGDFRDVFRAAIRKSLVKSVGRNDAAALLEWLPPGAATSLGRGEAESATLIPLPHAPHGNYLNSEIAALH